MSTKYFSLGDSCKEDMGQKIQRENQLKKNLKLSQKILPGKLEGKQNKTKQNKTEQNKTRRQ